MYWSILMSVLRHYQRPENTEKRLLVINLELEDQIHTWPDGLHHERSVLLGKRLFPGQEIELKHISLIWNDAHCVRQENHVLILP